MQFEQILLQDTWSNEICSIMKPRDFENVVLIVLESMQTVHYCKCMVGITRKLTLVITYFSTQKMAHSNIKWLHIKPLKELLIEN